MRICVVFRADTHEGELLPCYPLSYVEAFREMGHEVEVVGDPAALFTYDPPRSPDFALEVENGRDERGELHFRLHQRPLMCRSAVLLFDTHGHPDLHAEIAKSYDHVFFGSWVKRDVFAGHTSAHWCPSATDPKWFGAERFAHITPEIDVGFFGSKKGLSRADDLVAACKANGWTYDVRQVGRPSNPNRWPATGEAMAGCRVLFNRGQKHDSPNLRCIESMAMGRPLLSNEDPASGMEKLFTPGQHYMPYRGAESLSRCMRGMLESWTSEGAKMAHNARREVESHHLVKHRAQQILEVVSK